MSETLPRPLQDVRAKATGTNRVFLDYCLSLPTERGFPRRADFDPFAVQAAVGQLVIYERRAHDHYHIRLFGTRVVERLGYDATNTNLLDITDYAQKDRICAVFARMLDDGLGHFSIVQDRFASGRIAKVQIVRLPFLDRNGTASLIIASTDEIDPVHFADRSDRPALVADPVESWLFALAATAAA